MIKLLLAGRLGYGGFARGSGLIETQLHLEDIIITSELDLIDREFSQCPDPSRLIMYPLCIAFLLLTLLLIYLFFSAVGYNWVFAGMSIVTAAWSAMYYLYPRRPFSVQLEVFADRASNSLAGDRYVGELAVWQMGCKLSRNAYRDPALLVTPLRQFDFSRRGITRSGNNVSFGVFVRLRGLLGPINLLIGVSPSEELAIHAANRLVEFDCRLNNVQISSVAKRLVACRYGESCAYRRRRSVVCKTDSG